MKPLGCAAVAIGLVLAAWLGVLVATGSFGVIPGVTHSREVVADMRGPSFAMGPDSSRFVYGLQFAHVRDAIGLNAFPDGGAPLDEGSFYELYSCDLKARSTPTLVAAWDVPPTSEIGVLAFDGETVTISVRDSGALHHEAVDIRGSRRGRIPDSALDSLIASQHRPRGSASLAYSGGIVSLWHLWRREEEILFALPALHRGRRIARSGSWPDQRRARAAAFAIHRPWSVEAHPGRDSLRLDVVTYVPTPGTNRRDYSVQYLLSVPDTTREQDGVAPWIEARLFAERYALGPQDTTIRYTVGWDELEPVLEPYRRRTRGGMHEPWTTAVTVRIVPIVDEADSIEAYEGIWKGEARSVRVVVPAPR